MPPWYHTYSVFQAKVTKEQLGSQIYCGFTLGPDTQDLIFTLWQMSVKTKEWCHCALYFIRCAKQKIYLRILQSDLRQINTKAKFIVVSDLVLKHKMFSSHPHPVPNVMEDCRIIMPPWTLTYLVFLVNVLCYKSDLSLLWVHILPWYPTSDLYLVPNYRKDCEARQNEPCLFLRSRGQQQCSKK